MAASAEDHDALLERANERANTAHNMFMLLDADADGLVPVEQASSLTSSPPPPHNPAPRRKHHEGCTGGSIVLPGGPIEATPSRPRQAARPADRLPPLSLIRSTPGGSSA